MLALHDPEDALSVGRAGPAITEPAGGDTLPGSAVTFCWTANGAALSR